MTLRAFLVAILLGAPLAGASDVLVPLADAAGLDEHSSILIEGDAQFAFPLSGVRAGSGTPTDPYVISDWEVAQTQSFAVRLVGTRAHVVIERIATEDTRDMRLYRHLCQPLWICTVEGAAIQLEDTQNVTIRSVDVRADSNGVTIWRSAKVHVSDLRVGSESSQVGGGIGIVESEDVSVVDSSTPNARVPFWIRESARVLIEGFEARGGDSQLGPVTDFTLARSVFTLSNVDVWDPATNVSVEDNDFLYAHFRADWGVVTSGLFCGNSFSKATGDAALEIFGAEGIRIAGNVFSGNSRALEVQVSERVSIEGNRINGSSARGLLLGYYGGEVHNNSFYANPGGHLIVGATNASGNWWGSADGPVLDPNASSDLVRTFGEVALVPWREAALPVARSCAGETRPALPPAPASSVTATLAGANAVGAQVVLRPGPASEFDVSFEFDVASTDLVDLFGTISENGTVRFESGSFGFGEFYSAHAGLDGLTVDQLPLTEGGWRVLASYTCRAAACPHSLFALAGGSGVATGNVTVRISDLVGTVEIIPAAAGFIGITEMEHRIASAGVSVVGLGAGATFDASATIDIGGRLIGESMYYGGAGVADFTLETANGTRPGAGIFNGEPAGSYTFRLNAAGAGAAPRVWILYGDFDVR